MDTKEDVANALDAMGLIKESPDSWLMPGIRCSIDRYSWGKDNYGICITQLDAITMDAVYSLKSGIEAIKRKIQYRLD